MRKSLSLSSASKLLPSVHLDGSMNEEVECMSMLNEGNILIPEHECSPSRQDDSLSNFCPRMCSTPLPILPMSPIPHVESSRPLDFSCGPAPVLATNESLSKSHLTYVAPTDHTNPSLSPNQSLAARSALSVSFTLHLPEPVPSRQLHLPKPVPARLGNEQTKFVPIVPDAEEVSDGVYAYFLCNSQNTFFFFKSNCHIYCTHTFSRCKHTF